MLRALSAVACYMQTEKAAKQLLLHVIHCNGLVILVELEHLVP